MLVHAGPGTGKTRLLTALAIERVRATPDERWRVLCLTFTVEAAQQMRDRIAAAGLPAGQAYRVTVRNFHQWAAELLAAYGHLLGWPRDAQILAPPDDEELMREVLADLRLRSVNAYDVLRDISRLRHVRIASNAVPAATLQGIMTAYAQSKRQYWLRDYDDIIIDAIELLDDPRVRALVHSLYGHVLVDELQDTSRHQLDLVGRISDEGSTRLFGVADDDQMIYSWRDARPENLAEFEKRFGAQRRSLLGNYRCPPAIVEAANAVIAPNRPPGAARAYSRVTDRPGELLVAEAGWRDDEAGLVADCIVAERDAGRLLGSIAVLAAVTFLFERIEKALVARRVPVVQIGDRSARTPLSRLVRATLGAQIEGSVRAQESLARIVSESLDEADEAAEATRLLRGATTADAILTLAASILDVEDGDAELAHVRRLWRLAARDMGGASATQVGARLRLQWARLDAKLRRESDAVKLMTTFTAKGLQFETVILPGYGQALMPYRPKGVVTDEAWLREERRKAYVALTRASHRVIFVYSGQPSMFLDAIPARCLAPWSPAAAVVRTLQA